MLLPVGDIFSDFCKVNEYAKTVSAESMTPRKPFPRGVNDTSETAAAGSIKLIRGDAPLSLGFKNSETPHK
jgi:hypothetical protein